MAPDEQQLIQNALRGDKESFTTLVRQYQNRVFGFIMRMTANRDTALDLTQETFLAAFQHLDGFRGDSSFSTWLFQIAANKTKNFLKRAGREVPLSDGYDQPSNVDRPDIDLEKREQERLLAKAVEALPYKQRVTFALRYFEQMKFADIARIQGVSVSAAKTNFAEALKKLQNRLSGL
jgi:RNA polymerase sigma-70 factor (ECF subfamily)